MDEKNRFSLLVEQLMSAANLKNTVIAQALQYDVSYISKWLNGRSIPAKKSADEILLGISHCVVEELTGDNLENVCQDYGVNSSEDLEQAIYDNLKIEYEYVSNLKDTIGSYVAPKTSYYAFLPMPEFVSKMQHPALRKVKSLDVVASMDIISVNREYRLMMMQIDERYMRRGMDFPKVHFSLAIDLEIGEHDCFHDCIFLVNALTSGSHINLDLYGCSQSYGKIIFAVKDTYAISGMLFDKNSCVAVMISEEEEIRQALYVKAKALCVRERLLFRRTPMQEMIADDRYTQSLLSPNIRMLLGRMQEYFLPPGLFDEIISKGYVFGNPDRYALKLKKIYELTQNLLNKSKLKLMISESALFSLSISGELDFFNQKVILTVDQRMEYLKHMLSIIENNQDIQIKMVCRNFASDYHYRVNPCLFLSDRISYIRVENEKYSNNLMVFNHVSVKKSFDCFYEQIWSEEGDIIVDDRIQVCNSIRHVIQGLQIMPE